MGTPGLATRAGRRRGIGYTVRGLLLIGGMAGAAGLLWSDEPVTAIQGVRVTESGTATLIAPVVPVPDAETADLMLAYHAHLLKGRPAAEALALAQQDNPAADPVARVAAAGFVCLGDGTRSTTPRTTDQPSSPEQA